MVAKNEENRLLYCSALSEQSDRVKFDDDVKEAFRNEKEKKKQGASQLCASFFVKEDAKEIFPPKFQLEAERSEVPEQIVTKAQYVLNLMTK